MIHRVFSYLLTLLGLAAVSCSNPKPDPKPNIVLILVDDLGKEWVSTYGAEDIRTPNIDALGASGMVFNNVYAMPQCTPTRLTLLTGQYPFRHGWVNHWDVPRWGGGAHFDETENPSLGKEMKKAGYRTCIAGKWQIDDFRVEPDALTRNGFDQYLMWTGYESGIPASGERYFGPYLFSNEGSKTYEGAFGPDLFTEFIIDFINKNKEDPFFVYYPMVLTHPPLVTTPDDTATSMHGKHKGMVRYADKITGQIMNALKEAKVDDNTIIIWTTDNGTSKGLKGMYNGTLVSGAKSETSEPGINVPFMVRWPKEIEAGIRSDELIDFSDLFPTLAELAGRDLNEFKEASFVYKLDGHSFKDVLFGKPSRREWILSMGGKNRAKLTSNGVENEYVFRDRVIRNKKYKLYIDSTKEPIMFINLQDDPFETQNLIDSLNDQNQADFNKLVELISSFPDKDNDPRYKPNPSQPWDVEITAESQVWKKSN